ncbi:MAG TPA: four helix bundle protein [Planctomycetota bacterium]|nr:four helix bundle protein [Planctomycetota bacterium]
MGKDSKKRYDLGERTAKFAEAVIEFAKGIPASVVNRPIIRQLVRSATSVGANYCEADDAESENDFVHKIRLCARKLTRPNTGCG